MQGKGDAKFYQWVMDFVKGMIKGHMNWKTGGIIISWITLILYLFCSDLLGLPICDFI